MQLSTAYPYVYVAQQSSQWYRLLINLGMHVATSQDTQEKVNGRWMKESRQQELEVETSLVQTQMPLHEVDLVAMLVGTCIWME